MTTDPDDPDTWNRNPIRLRVSSEMIEDAERMRPLLENMHRQMWEGFDRLDRPWAYPDRATGWVIDPLPTITRIIERIAHHRRQARAARQRITDTWAVARGHATVYDGDHW